MKRLLLTSVLGMLVIGLVTSCASLQGKKAEKAEKAAAKAEAKAEKEAAKEKAVEKKAEAKEEAKAAAPGELQKVESSVIDSVGYDPATQDLTIVLVKGETYVYHKVPEKVYKGLMAADSKGKFFQKKIKDKFEFTKK